MNWVGWFSAMSMNFGGGGGVAGAASNASSGRGASGGGNNIDKGPQAENTAVNNEPNTQTVDLAQGPINVVGSNSYNYFRNNLNPPTQVIAEEIGFRPQILNASNIFLTCYNHFQVGRNKPLYFDASTLDISFISRNHPALKNLKEEESATIDLFAEKKLSQASLALGKIKLTYEGNDEFSIQEDDYDFNIEWKNGFSMRNIGTFIAGLLHGPVLDNRPILTTTNALFGGPFTIYFVGKIKLRK